jgi:3-oxoacyl-[acyl-carrier protein] reductase
MRRALVTGGASPIGAAICRALARDGCRVIVHGHANAAAAAAALAVEIGGEHATFDVTDHGAAQRAVDALLEPGADPGAGA